VGSDEVEQLLGQAREERAAGRPAEARLTYARAADLARLIGDDRQSAHALRHVADLAREARDPGSSLAASCEAVVIYRRRTDFPPLDLANALRLTALALEDLGRGPESAVCWREARDLYRQGGVDAGVQECDAHLTGPVDFAG
jgi:hypothetical protein